MRFATLGCCLALSLCTACDDDAAQGAPHEDVDFRPSTGGGGTGGMYLNTNAIGPYAFAGLDTTGQTYEGVKLDKVEIKQGPKFIVVDQVWADDGELYARKGATVYSGAQLVGSRWTLTHYLVGGKVTMHIASREATGPVPLYDFQYGANQQGQPVCAADQAGNTRAVMLPDLTVSSVGEMATRANTLYLGCVSGAVGKAVTWGYSPWELGLLDFEAAVRVVRADYCGDGTSWTQPGTALQLADVWAINGFADATAPLEAVWGEAGALCLTAPRSGQYERASITCDGAPIPTCDAAASLTSVEGALFASRKPAP